MSDEPNPYASPFVPAGSLAGLPAMPFGSAISRGLGAAHQTLLAAVLIFCVIAPQQVASMASGALLLSGGLKPPAEGQPPSPALLAIMGIGCFTCIWLPVIVFALPWVGAGMFGQLADRVAGVAVRPYRFHASRFYTRILLLTLITIGLVLVLIIPVWITGAVIGAEQMKGNAFDPDAMRALSRHPANVAVGLAFGLGIVAISTVMILAQASVVLDESQVSTAISQALRFLRGNFGDAAKLYGILVLTSIPTAVLQQAGNLLPTVSMAVLVAVFAGMAVWISYSTVLNAGMGLSVFAARRGTQ